jgi:hypothetical protein
VPASGGASASLDFVIQFEGELQLTLDSGETLLLRLGDLTI